MSEPNPNPHSNYYEYQLTKDLNVFIREYGQAFLNDSIPAPPLGMTNIVWQTDSKGNISAYTANAGGGGSPVQASTFAGTITGAIPGSTYTLPSQPDPGSLLLQWNGQVLTPGLGYTLSGPVVTLAVPLDAGDGLNANYTIGSGGGGGSNLTFLSSVLAPSEPGNFQVSHTLGKVPTGVILYMTSGGQVWFQSPIMFDSSNVYLVASDSGLTGFVQVFG